MADFSCISDDVLTLFPLEKSRIKRITQLTGGTTNSVFKIEMSDDTVVILRVYGKDTELLIDRKKEIEVCSMLESSGKAPKVLYSNNIGRIEEYFAGRSLHFSELKLEKIRKIVVLAIADFHRNVSDEVGPEVHEATTKHLLECENLYSQSPENLTRVHRLQKVNESLQQQLNQLKNEACSNSVVSFLNEVVLCHNDNNASNILYQETEEMVRFVDLEYAGYNSRLYDISNYFCEYAGLDCDFDRDYPTHTVQIECIQDYLRAAGGGNIDILSTWNMETERYVLRMTRLAACCSHLYWGLWAMIQAKVSSIPDFDFMVYGNARLKVVEAYYVKEWGE